MPTSPTPLVGDRYRLLDLLGSGAMGKVWLARDEQLNRDVAVKEVLIPGDLDDTDRATLRARVLREARTAARLDDSTVVHVYDVVDDGVRPWIVMELLRGHTVADAIREHGRLPSSFVASVGVSVLRALRVTHAAGILHRDVKPSNVMLADDGRIVLTDFGVASVEGDPSLTSSGMLIGSPSYLPPERARGERPGPPADLWSLGATLYAAVEGHAPFERGSALATITAAMTEAHSSPEFASPALASAIDGLLVKDPAARLDAVTAGRLLREAEASQAATMQLPLVVDAAPQAPVVAPKPPVAPKPVVITARAAAAPPVGATSPAREQAERDYSVVLSRPVPAGRATSRKRVLGVAAGAAILAGTLTGAAILDTPLQSLWAQPDASPPGAGSADDGAGSTPVDQPSDSASQAAPLPSATTAPTVAPTDLPVTPLVPAPSEPESGPSIETSTAPVDDGAVPPGFRLHEDETGFSVVVPSDWTVERDGSMVDFEDPGSGRFLRIDQTDDPKGDPVADWVAQEQSVSQRLDGYQLIRIDGLYYRGWEAADWEFTFGVNTPTHVVNRNVVTGDMAYALYWSVPATEWEASQEVFDIAADTFEPAG